MAHESLHRCPPLVCIGRSHGAGRSQSRAFAEDTAVRGRAGGLTRDSGRGGKPVRVRGVSGLCGRKGTSAAPCARGMCGHVGPLTCLAGLERDVTLSECTTSLYEKPLTQKPRPLCLLTRRGRKNTHRESPRPGPASRRGAPPPDAPAAAQKSACGADRAVSDAGRQRRSAVNRSVQVDCRTLGAPERRVYIGARRRVP
jgi:hypothetical protein